MQITLKINTYKELIEYLNNNHNYLIFRGLDFPISCLAHDIDILIDKKEEMPKIKFPRELHFQYEEKHKGVIFMPQKALKRKKWNGEYYEPNIFDKIRMKFLRKFRQNIYLKD